MFAAPSTNPFGLIGLGYYASPIFADIDGDGDLDALLGEGSGNTVFKEIQEQKVIQYLLLRVSIHWA